MKNKFQNSMKLFAILFFAGFILTSCSSDDDPITPEPDPEPEVVEELRDFTVAISVGSGRNPAKVYTQALTDLSVGDISFDGFGYEMPSTRTARIFTSNDGTQLYDLDYGGGRIYKFDVNGGQDYTQVAEKNVEFAMGTAYPRWTKANENLASIQYADGGNAVRVFDEITEEYIRTDVTLRIMTVSLDNLDIGAVEQFEIPVSGVDAGTYDYVNRVDAPIIVGDKAYYGMGKAGYNPADPTARIPAVYPNVETLVVDYPSLTNPRIISTNVGGAKGATNGYRTPVAHLDENGDIFQIISVPDNTFETHILKLRDGAYDESYDFNLSQLLGENTTSNGWFYAGNGIGYVPYANTDLGGLGDSVWSVARVDLYNNTAVKLNLPENLWLQQYQNAVVEDGKFYMAITPTGVEGNIYIFDIESSDPNGFTVGASLESLADATYIGVY
ncbi:hypothetical protein [Urechidicola croceus]|uniref:DUF4374 domain-containing protein n=1 Tax=Urechidicola croceus TaxID=1850246 RepID=A0A1D8P6D4_9FLAO|nr:hypothetical protein [Urechidicola croceus]AOW20122.1 hypothetical protein LPB138_05250 [Urechidicola croceus]